MIDKSRQILDKICRLYNKIDKSVFILQLPLLLFFLQDWIYLFQTF